MPTADRKKQRKDTAVQGTNDSSAVSKVSAAALGYFRDDFLKHFVCKRARRAPLINRGYYVRWKAVDHCVKKFLQVTAHCPTRQILSLGAGFDSLFFRLQAEAAVDAAVVFEVDFPDVAQRKVSLIDSNITLREALGAHTTSLSGPVYISSPHYNLLGVDIREESCLSACGLDWTAPTLILSEVALTYMDTQWSDAVIGWASKLLPLSLFVMYEQIRPDDPFGRIMMDHFLKLNSALHALRSYPDTDAQRRRFIDRGWDECVCLDMNDFYLNLIPEEERRRVESLEPFDEYEEWHQKCSHYFILTASRGSLTAQALLSHADVPSCPSLSSSVGAVLNVQPVPVCVEGLGLACSELAPDQILLTGGAGRAGREQAARMLYKDQGEWRTVIVETSGAHLGIRLYHSATALPGGGSVIVYGGRSSPLHPTTGLFRVSLCTHTTPEHTHTTPEPTHTPSSLIDTHTTTKPTHTPSRLIDTHTTLEPTHTPSGLIDTHTTPEHTHTPSSLTDTHTTPEPTHTPSSLIDTHTPPGPINSPRLCADQMVCSGDSPPLRWRHTATTVTHNGKDFLFVFGGKNQSEAVLGDWGFLCVETQHWTELPVGGAAPSARHSHSACRYGDGALLFGGLDRQGAPLGDTVHLKPSQRGFSWERVLVNPPPTPRYSHSAHVVGERLVVAGGVWLRSDRPPGLLSIHLTTGCSVELSLDTSAVPFPLMLHSFCSQLIGPEESSQPIGPEEPRLLLIGGGGNCFSFGTHFNPRPVAVDLKQVLTVCGTIHELKPMTHTQEGI